MSNVTINIPNKEQDDKCDKWIDYSCDKKNITLIELFRVCQHVHQQLDLKGSLPEFVGGGDLTDHEALMQSWIPTIKERILTRIENGES